MKEILESNVCTTPEGECILGRKLGTLTIKDLEISKELTAEQLSAVCGGFSFGVQSPGNMEPGELTGARASLV